MKALEDILKELQRELKRKEESYFKMMEDIKYDTSKLNSSEANSAQLMRFALVIEKQIALAREIEITKEHIDLVKIEIKHS